MQSMIHHAKIDPGYGAEAVDNVVYTLNRTCSRLLPEITPFEAYTGNKPSLSRMLPFGCKVYTHIPNKL